MIRKAFRQGFLAVLLGLGAFSVGTAAELRGITVASDSHSAQVTLDLTDGARQNVFTLENPDRVVIDLPHTHMARGVRAPASAGVITGMRIGPQPRGTLRVVVQLKSALPAHSTWGSSSDGRLLILTFGETAVAVASAATGPKSVRAVHAPGEGDRDVVIAVDAGHGGVDPGAIGHGGTREKDVTLAIARALATRIDAEPGMRAVLTRNRDEFLELRERIARARAAHADMFVSVHADSIADRSVTGASVYVLSVHGASSEAARVLADRENSADLMGGIPVEDSPLGAVLIDATQSEIIGMSAGAAERVVTALEGVGEIRKAQVQRAGFVVLKSPAIPSMLVETAYISNPTEERRLRSPDQQMRLADAIASGVRSYFLQNPPDGTRIKQERRMASVGDAQTASAGH